jgi:PIN domain nuclease of toxin-antitoxin system
MRVLLDTHTLLWRRFGDERLSKRVRALLLDMHTQIWVSSASGRGIATRYRLGSIPEAAPFVEKAETILHNLSGCPSFRYLCPTPWSRVL